MTKKEISALGYPFTEGELYPLLCIDCDGRRKDADFCDGAFLEGFGHWGRFSDLPKEWQTFILANFDEELHKSIKRGEVWSKKEEDEEDGDAEFYAVYCR